MEKQRQAERRKYHYIYKTTCSINNKFYYGMHSTDNLDDGYIGSGTKLWHSIKKYGRENFSLEILEHLPSREALKIRERELVNEEMLKDPMCMNLTLGGEGGWNAANKSITPEQRRKSGLAGGYANRHLWSEETKDRVAKQMFIIRSKTGKIAMKKAWKTNPEAMYQILSNAIKAAASPEANIKRKATMKANGHSQGNKNSQFGKCWVFNSEGSKSIRLEELEEYLVNGYTKGRKL